MRNVSPGALPGFLRQHYTTGNDMAGTMASYVLGNGGTQQVAEPPSKREPKQEPKQEPRQRARSDAPEVAARTIEPKEQSRSAKQRAARKGQLEPSAKDVPAPHEAEKPEAPKGEMPVAKPETPATEGAKSETAAADCKVEPAKQADESKPGFVVLEPSTTPPKQPAALLTLPGFPAPVPEPEPEPAAKHEGCEPGANGTSTPVRAEAPAAEQPKEQPKDEPKEPAPAASPAALAEAPKSEAAKPEPLRATVSEPAQLDIMQEEVHAPPRPMRASQQKKRAQ
jgi:hypothetical protein